MTITKARQRISDFQSHINSRVREIRGAGDQAWQGVTAKGEVETVREFLVGRGRGTDYLNRNLASLLGTDGRVVKFASIFLHQMPMVVGIRNRPSGQPARLAKRCELGDLQTLFLYLDRDKNVCQARSVIFQAKRKPDTGNYVINHPQQRELYDKCTGFEYDTVLKGETRELPRGHYRARALQYIFVEERPVRVRTIPSDADQGAFENFGEHLLRFLNDSTGLDVPPSRTTDDAWGKVVWDMIDHVASVVTNQTPIRKSGLQGLLDHFNHFENRETFSIDATGGKRLREGEGGFGLQLVIVWDSELGEKSLIRTTIKPKIGVKQTLKPVAPSGKYVLHSANIHDMLANLESSSLREQLEIIKELTLRTQQHAVSDHDARAILKVLNAICHCLSPDAASIASRLKHALDLKETRIVKRYVSQ
jgi:hypothetical protein